MHFNQFLPTFLLLLAAVLSSWLVIKSLQEPVDRPESPQNPDAYVFNINAVKMNVDTGTPTDQLFSPEMVHYPTNNSTNITTPHLTVFQNNEQPWQINADRGQAINGSEVIQLWDHVKLEQAAGPNNQAFIITTTAMTIYPKQQYAETNQPIMLWQPSGTVNSVGLRAYQTTGIIDLLSQVKGHYLSTRKN